MRPNKTNPKPFLILPAYSPRGYAIRKFELNILAGYYRNPYICNRWPFSSARGSGARVMLGSCHKSARAEPVPGRAFKTVTAGAFTKTPTL
jgi:hypothetical protein